MKHFKRAAAMLLAVVLSLCLAVTAFAADTEQKTGSLTVTGSGMWNPSESKGKEVTAIRMFTARVTGDATTNPAQKNEFDSYVLEEKWEGFFKQTDLFKKVKAAGGITDEAVTADNITKEALSDAAVAYVKSLKNDETTNAGTLADFAHEAQKWAREKANKTTLTDAQLIETKAANNANDENDATKGTANFASLTAGYYLVFPEGGSTGDNSRGTDAILVNVPRNGGNTAVKIKSTFPTVDKTVSTDDGNTYKDNTTAQVGDTVYFKLTAKVPDMTDYTTYKFIFHDTLSNGLAYDAGSVKVTIGGIVYDGKTLTEILRERTTLKELNGFSMCIDEDSHVSSIDISFRQTVAENAAEKVAEKYHVPVDDIIERLIISSRSHEISYNRRTGIHERVSLSLEKPEAVKDLLAWYEERPLFETGVINTKPDAEEDISRTYQITVLYADKKSASYSGSFDKEGLPDNWADFIGRVAAFFDTESLGEMFSKKTFDRVPAKTDDAVFCGVEILGVVGVRYYRCDDEVCLNDSVVVPTPVKKQNLAGRVVEIRHCKLTSIPKELQKAKEVLYIIKDGDAEELG